MNDQRRFLLAMGLSLIVVLFYFTFIDTTADRARIDAQNEVDRASTSQIFAEGEGETSTLVITEPRPREELVAEGRRIKIDTPSLSGSFLTTGSRLDDITLKKYEETLDPEDGQVKLLSPDGGERSAYIIDNWTTVGGGTGADAEWAIVAGDTLTPSSPITLRKMVGDIDVTRVMSVDEEYLITLTDTLTNTGSSEFAIERKGITRQVGLPEDLTNFFVIQEGPISVIEGKYHEFKYKKLRKKGGWTDRGTGGWVGLTDKYWIQAAIAPQNQPLTVNYNYRRLNADDVYENSYTTDPLTLTPGATVTSVGHMIAAPKERDMLAAYEDQGIEDMSNAIGWGKLKILVKPINLALSWLGETLGNYGLGILALTLIIKIFMFPLYNKQYASQAKMKKVAPALKKLQTRYKDDRMKLQKEMMALYKKEGVNPAAGCLPIIPTIFVFFALYKAVFINIDLRHESFLGYIQDLSARDPVSILNGFGLFPWDSAPAGIPALLAVGPLAIMYGASMSLMYMLQTTPSMGASEQAAIQAKIFKFMPWIFMFIMAAFPAGLLIYWIWNSILSFLQQYYITRKFGVDTPIDKFFRKITGKPEPVTAGEAVEVKPNKVTKKKKK